MVKNLDQYKSTEVIFSKIVKRKGLGSIECQIKGHRLNPECFQRQKHHNTIINKLVSARCCDLCSRLLT